MIVTHRAILVSIHCFLIIIMIRKPTLLPVLTGLAPEAVTLRTEKARHLPKHGEVESLFS
jgi:hypothetical protein